MFDTIKIKDAQTDKEIQNIVLSRMVETWTSLDTSDNIDVAEWLDQNADKFARLSYLLNDAANRAQELRG